MCIQSIATPQDMALYKAGKSGAHQQNNDHPHENLLQVSQIFHTLQQGCCAAKECVLACLLHCMQTNDVKPLYMSERQVYRRAIHQYKVARHSLTLHLQYCTSEC